MDLLFTRYASPFCLIDNLILTHSLNNFIDDFFNFIIEERKEKTEWEFFLHKIYDKSWGEFSASIRQSENQKPIDLDATLTKSKNILNNFTPEGEV